MATEDMETSLTQQILQAFFCVVCLFVCFFCITGKENKANLEELKMSLQKDAF